MAELGRLYLKWASALLALVLAAWTVPLAASASAAELVMFDRSGCVWCLRWEREIGSIYPKTDEGRIAPLRHVSLDRGPPQGMKLTEPVFFSPTFVLMDNDREIGRITGYIGDDAFWGLLSVLIRKLRPGGKSGALPPAQLHRASFGFPAEAFRDTGIVSYRNEE